MKFLQKAILVMALLVFSSGVLFASIWKTSAQTASENFKVSPLTTIGAEAENEEATTSPEKVEYSLTWPGVLPDHFLYPVKMLRDRIWLWLTTDSLKKADLLLRLADKRVWSAQLLFEKGKTDLAITTAAKAERYLEQAIDQAEMAREKGKDTASFLEKLSRATLKHEEVLSAMKEKAEETAQPAIDSALEYARRGHERVTQALGE